MAKESFYTKMKRLGLWDKPISEVANFIDEKDKEIKELKVLIDGAMDVVTLFYPATEVQKRWRETWLKDAYEAVKEDSDG